VKAKFNQLHELLKGQIALKRLIKRNKKQEEAESKTVGGRKRGLKPLGQKEKKRVCKIPFIVVKFHPDNMSAECLTLQKKKMKLVSRSPLKCYGDATILAKMRLKEQSNEESLFEVLGPLGQRIPETFQRIEETI